ANSRKRAIIGSVVFVQNCDDATTPWTEGNMMVRGARIATLVTLWLVPLLIFVSAFSSDWIATWRSLGVPSMTPHFLDLQSIPAAIETLHKGGNPLAANPADPLHRSMNYPRVWLYIFSA